MTILGRAKKFLQSLGSEPPAKVQYFNVTCASGHRVRGERTEGYQALRCPACGEGVFVLPRSPLPEPAAPVGSAEPRPAAVQLDESIVEEGPVELTDAEHLAVDLVDEQPPRPETEIIWEDAPAKAAPRRGPAGVRVKPPADDGDAGEERRLEPGPAEEGHRAVARAADPAGPRRRPKPADGVPSRRPDRTADPEARAARPDRRESPRTKAPARPARPRHELDMPVPAALESQHEIGRRSHHRLIFLLVPFLVIAAVGWRYWNSRRQEFPLVVERGRTEGIPALDEGNFDKAYQLLSAAKSAVDALGGAFDDAELIRHAADEAAIFVDPAPLLEDLLAEAARTNPEAWATRFDTLYKGRSVIIDSKIRVAPDSGGSSAYLLWYRVFPPGEASNSRDGGVPRPDRFADIDLTGFELLERALAPKVDHRVVFGARLASLHYDSEKNHWVIRLDPRSGVFIEHPKALQASGWPVTKETDGFPEGRP